MITFDKQMIMLPSSSSDNIKTHCTIIWTTCAFFFDRFTPLVLIYLALVVPVVWVLEYTMLQLRIDVMNRTQSHKCPIILVKVPVIPPCVSDTNETAFSAYEETFIVDEGEAVRKMKYHIIVKPRSTFELRRWRPYVIAS